MTAVALLSTMVPDDGDDPRSVSAEPAALKAFGDAVQVTLKPVAGRFDSKCMLVDEDGNQLLLVSYDQAGLLWVQSGDAFPVRASCASTRSGRFECAVRDDVARYKIELYPDRVSGVKVIKLQNGDTREVGFTSDGELVADLDLLGREMMGSGSPEDQTVAGPAPRRSVSKPESP